MFFADDQVNLRRQRFPCDAHPNIRRIVCDMKRVVASSPCNKARTACTKGPGKRCARWIRRDGLPHRGLGLRRVGLRGNGEVLDLATDRSGILAPGPRLDVHVLHRWFEKTSLSQTDLFLYKNGCATAIRNGTTGQGQTSTLQPKWDPPNAPGFAEH